MLERDIKTSTSRTTFHLLKNSIHRLSLAQGNHKHSTTMSFWSVSLFFFAIIGFGTIIFSIYKAYLFISFHIPPFGNSLKKYQRQPRAWALITGASAGIGLGHARDLAARGFGVIILAHIEVEVNEAVAQIKAETKDAVIEKIILDATKVSYADIKSALAPYMHLPITILVNNLSVQSSRPMFNQFELYKPADINTSIAVNNLFTCNITHILYPVLKQNGPSLVISLSSGAILAGPPWLTLYSGTKAFTASWSQSMAREMKAIGHPIDFIAIIPGDVRTQKNIYGVAAGSPDGREFAKMTLDRIERAVSHGRKIISPYWKHHITIALLSYLPDSLIEEGIIADIGNRKVLEEKDR